jgi:surfactin synthase thioesterase subunit
MNKSLRIVALPYAGGDKYAYRSLERETPDWIEFVCLELPGRGMRRKEGLLNNMDQIAADYYRQLEALDHSIPYVLMGHSMGALSAFEVLRRISPYGNKLPSFVYISGCLAPSVFQARIITHLPGTEFWMEIKKFGGIPEQLFAYPEMLNLFEPIFKSDFSVLENYKYQPLLTPLKTEVHLRWGRSEPHPEQQYVLWKNDLQLSSVNQMDGGHFYILERASEVWEDIRQIYNNQLQKRGE